eukprot:CAMPEP_0113961188 /NCGR_PEP_ID=MMETSP0011_2-20120614/5158_1 /TAXON_ID=101924 /ORGANISM="Rhodosorus marinus" /LENGTH=395 /DNA_ID=CAMNT_0000972777 /DNA_START=318 /DNA_END=1505 /DNA_ORIENTATION=- /assembly_acc=CAM_ASM_000156
MRRVGVRDQRQVSRSRWFRFTVFGIFFAVTLVSVSLFEGVDEAKDAEAKEDVGSAEGRSAGSQIEEKPALKSVSMKILMVTDMDERSYDEANQRWIAKVQTGNVTGSEEAGFKVFLDPQGEGDLNVLVSDVAVGKRGMELSEFEYFAGKLLTGDDHTGVLYELDGVETGKYSLKKWLELKDLDGTADSAFKIEWMTVKDGKLIVGSHGRETTDPQDSSVVKGKERMWVKEIDEDGNVTHVDWTDRYDKIREAAGISFPGYLMHEAVLWDEQRRAWLFFPRRFSETGYDGDDNELKGWNHALILSEDFDKVLEDIDFEDLSSGGAEGFSSVKFMPGTDNRLVLALRSVERNALDDFKTFLSVLDLRKPKVILPESAVPPLDDKYEGLVFLRTPTAD